MSKEIPYDRLLKIARKMHLFIFLNYGDEDKVYKEEIGLTEEENAILGYAKIELKEENKDE